uniref:proline-rich proteoglycan 2 n=1 Tax=Callithrix jacchus TaxID=9483 RepID=UPI00159D61B1|nr:proline-rich proteoglycan 2 [Callithrix jacchus]
MRPRARGLLGTRWPLRHLHPEAAARPSEEAQPRAPSGPSSWDRGPCWRGRDGEREAGPGRLGETHQGPPAPSSSERSLRQWDLVGGESSSPSDRRCAGREAGLGASLCALPGPPQRPRQRHPEPAASTEPPPESPLGLSLGLSPPLPPWVPTARTHVPSLAAAAAPA